MNVWSDAACEPLISACVSLCAGLLAGLQQHTLLLAGRFSSIPLHLLKQLQLEVESQLREKPGVRVSRVLLCGGA